MQTPILRYDDIEFATTPLDPIEDITCWISGLRSLGYTQDLLKSKHGIVGPAELSKSAKAIAAHCDAALGLLEEAFSGPAHVSFLPLYYALLNLSKAYIIAAGRRSTLERQRWHGATYNVLRKASRGLLTEEIVLKTGGSIPLLYQVLTGQAGWSGDKRIRMSDIYPHIANISYEYRACCDSTPAFATCSLSVVQPSSGNWQLKLNVRWPETLPSINEMRVVHGLNVVPHDPRALATQSVRLGEREARAALMQKVQRHLIYNWQFDYTHGITFYTPISRKRLAFPEEMPILLAFYHLSNVVRYNPEFLARLSDSRQWPMLLALRKHGCLRFLLLFWSFMHKTCYGLTS